MLKKGMDVAVVLVAGVWAGVCGPANAAVWQRPAFLIERGTTPGHGELWTVGGGRMSSGGTEVSFGMGSAEVPPGANGFAFRYSVAQHFGLRAGRKVVPYVLWGGGGVSPIGDEHNYSYEEVGAGLGVWLRRGLEVRIGLSRVSGKFDVSGERFPTTTGLSLAVVARL